MATWPRPMPFVVAVVGLVGVIALGGCSGSDDVPAAPNSPGNTAVGTAGSTGTPSAAATTPAGTAVARPDGSPQGLIPVWPFTTTAQVQAWQSAYRSTGAQAWHLDVDRTALSFATSRLGYTEVDRVTSRTVNGADALIGIGWNDPNETTATVAVLHLIRFGTGQDAPWAVVGSQDGLLTLTRPAYGSTVRSPLTIGGVISGVDESLRVVVWGAGSDRPLAQVGSISAGGTAQPWGTTLTVNAPAGTVLTIAVSTGGHLATVERFAITAVRLG